ncbi:MAG TPA: rubredoxin [Firmicutes bacterium]|jgi:rubredoxin|nr:rubredoxin [Bacillota bacterium]
MEKYICTVCGFVYDEAQGIPDAGIPPGTKWEDLPEDWVCPICGATKDEFEQEESAPAAPVVEKKAASDVASTENVRELTPLEISALCTNLARGCEKQYKPAEAESFMTLAAFFKSAAPSAQDPAFDQLLTRIEEDLTEGFPNANATAKEVGDRGALRALTWSEKVTRILKSLLTRYAKEGDAMLENTGVYVCTICGFVYVGDQLPEVCPVCKVPNWKFAEVEGR